MIQDYPQELDLKSTILLDPDRAERINLTLRSAELFQILVLKTDGEAKLVVKSVPDEDGIRAWQVLHSTTTARRSRRPSGTTGMACTRGHCGNW